MVQKTVRHSQKQKIYYKVVRQDASGNFISARAFPIEGSIVFGRIQYKIGVWAYPLATSNLFVFDSLEHAQSFVKDFVAEDRNPVEEKIFTCEVIGGYRPKYICKFIHDIEQFWRNWNRRKKISGFGMKPPKGTVLVEAVKLLEEVKL